MKYRMIGQQSAVAPLFLVSLAATGYEIALTRYFAVAQWSDYGYWIISIVMVGFALSGVVLSLVRDFAVRHAAATLAALPALLVATAALGFHWTAANPFNPLQLQNADTWLPQVGNIGLYYLGLLPFFFLAGLYIGISFIVNSHRIGRIYGFDLLGAGCGALAILGAMFFLHPFRLVPALLLPLALSALFAPRKRPIAVTAAAFALLGGEALLLLGPAPAISDFKAIYVPLHVPHSHVAAEVRSPRGYYQLLDEFMERVDTDVSNDAGMLGLPGPPTSFGLYRDGMRIAALPRPGVSDTRYAASALDALPYLLHPKARVLQAGGSGGFGPRAALSLGAAEVTVLEPEPILLRALRHGLGPSPALAADPRLVILGEGPLAAVHRAAARDAHYDIIDVSENFLEASEANATAFTAEAIAADWHALSPDGILSLPVSIRDFPVYALRLLSTVREGLRQAGVSDPRPDILAYRSAWNVRILVSRQPWTAHQVQALRRFCDDRSFDVVFYAGMDVAAARASLYNDLPAVSFENGTVDAHGPDDALADEAGAVLSGLPTLSGRPFHLRPITLDRPAFFAVLRLGHLDTIFRRLEILPQNEIGALVNLAVLVQAVLIALLVLLVPVLGRLGRRRRLPPVPARLIARSALYFAALGLGFLFLEIAFIEKGSLWLNDRSSGFALVLSGMLIFSGIGSMLAPRFAGNPRTGLALAVLVILVMGLCLLFGGERLLLAGLDWPWIIRAGIMLLLLMPASVALGLPFALGLGMLGKAQGGSLLPWAWALNGAFSIVATPLANLIAREEGFACLIVGAMLLYGAALLAFPIPEDRDQSICHFHQ